MKRLSSILLSILAAMVLIILLSCAKHSGSDLVNDRFAEEQAQIREIVKSIVNDAENADIAGLQAIHLNSEKFTKFGPRNFERQDVEGTNESEAAFFGSIANYKQESRDLKVDVFGELAIATYYPYVSFEQDGEFKEANGRQTLVFLKTTEGWKIVHEHGTPRGQ